MIGAVDADVVTTELDGDGLEAVGSGREFGGNEIFEIVGDPSPSTLCIAK